MDKSLLSLCSAIAVSLPFFSCIDANKEVAFNQKRLQILDTLNYTLNRQSTASTVFENGIRLSNVEINKDSFWLIYNYVVTDETSLDYKDCLKQNLIKGLVQQASPSQTIYYKYQISPVFNYQDLRGKTLLTININHSELNNILPEFNLGCEMYKETINRYNKSYK